MSSIYQSITQLFSAFNDFFYLFFFINIPKVKKITRNQLISVITFLSNFSVNNSVGPYLNALLGCAPFQFAIVQRSYLIQQGGVYDVWKLLFCFLWVGLRSGWFSQRRSFFRRSFKRDFFKLVFKRCRYWEVDFFIGIGTNEFFETAGR